VDARKIVASSSSSSSSSGGLGVVFDLGVELGGVWAYNAKASAVQTYTTRMWQDYGSAFKSRADCLGFSFAGGNGKTVTNRVGTWGRSSRRTRCPAAGHRSCGRWTCTAASSSSCRP